MLMFIFNKVEPMLVKKYNKKKNNYNLTKYDFLFNA